jgi:hypothetical protein
MTNALRDAWIKREFDYRDAAIRASGRPRAGLERQARDQLVMPEFLPEIEGAMLGTDGSIWLKSHGLNEWLIVSATATIVARVRVPAEVIIKQVSLDRLWGIVPDADGVPSIVRYKVF